jgi:hypothetical protein
MKGRREGLLSLLVKEGEDATNKEQAGGYRRCLQIAGVMIK